jgi:hypothetical protein
MVDTVNTSNPRVRQPSSIFRSHNLQNPQLKSSNTPTQGRLGRPSFWSLFQGPLFYSSTQLAPILNHCSISPTMGGIYHKCTFVQQRGFCDSDAHLNNVPYFLRLVCLLGPVSTDAAISIAFRPISILIGFISAISNYLILRTHDSRYRYFPDLSPTRSLYIRSDQ